jgi:hypothetical protein
MVRIRSEKGGERTNDMTMEPTNDVSAVQLTWEVYESPQVLVYGNLMELARGSGSDDADGCSSGHYDVE